MDHSINSMKRTKPIPGGETQSEYRSTMKKIMEGLTKTNLETVLFLCKDHIPHGREINTALQLLKYLEERDLVSCHSAVFIAEALHIIRRMDLLKVIPCIRNKKHFEEDFLAFAYSSFSPYRVLTVQLQDELSQRDFESFRHECSQHLNIRNIDQSGNVLSLLRNLEEEDVISGDDFTELLKILENIDNVKPLKMFRRLLDGDETVVLPLTKQQQRQNSEQDMFPDRRAAPISYSNPPSYHSANRVEIMPHAYQSPPPVHASISTRSEQHDTLYTTEKYHHRNEVRYNFDDPDGNIRVFCPDEVTPKAIHSSHPEPQRMDSHRSMPPEYRFHDPHEHRSQSYSEFSFTPTSPPQYNDHGYGRAHSLHGYSSYPQFPRMEGQRMAGEQRYRYDQPPQSSTYDHSTPQPYGYQKHPPVYGNEFGQQARNAASYQPIETHQQKRIDDHQEGQIRDKLEGLTMLSNVNTVPTRDRVLLDPVEGTDVKQTISTPQQAIHEVKETAEQLEPVEKQDDTDEESLNCYKMDSSPVGLCVLINNVDFVRNRNLQEYDRRSALNSQQTGQKLELPRIDLSDREGSDKDADKLQTLFDRLDFDVQRHDNLDHKAMKRVLVEASDVDHSNHDCFLLIILSHGDAGCVFGVGGFKLKTTDIQAMFVAEKCWSLANKPKIVIIQACQGGKSMPAYSPEADVIAHDGPVSDDGSDKGVANKADFLMAYSTVPGYISYRSRLEGSYYVQEIIRIFKRYHQREDLLSMMIMVNHAVGKYQKKQVPMPVPTLRKKVFFHLRDGCTLDDLEDSRVTEFPSIENPNRLESGTQESGEAD